MSDKPECFGILWEGVESNPTCWNCLDKDECLVKFVSGVLLEYQEELGPAASLHALAELTTVKPAAIFVAMDYQQKHGIRAQPGWIHDKDPDLDLMTREPEKGAQEAQESVQEPKLPQVDSGLLSFPEEPPEPSDVPETLSPVQEPLAPKENDMSEKPAPKKVAPRTRKAATKPKKRDAPKTGKVSPKKTTQKAEEPSANFPGAGAALHVVAPAKTAKAGSVPRAEVRDDDWSPRHDLIRFKRERDPKRRGSRLIRKLRPGDVLVKDYQSERHECVVEKDHYTYRSRKFPTLYAVVKYIVGTANTATKQPRRDGSQPKGTRSLVAWSAVKFWGLHKQLQRLEEERENQEWHKKKMEQKKKKSQRKGKKKKPPPRKL